MISFNNMNEIINGENIDVDKLVSGMKRGIQLMEHQMQIELALNNNVVEDDLYSEIQEMHRVLNLISSRSHSHS
jgi:2-hydroxy-3-keto-5-methylthiopentenyl-1-phosphate phosphatase